MLVPTSGRNFADHAPIAPAKTARSASEAEEFGLDAAGDLRGTFAGDHVNFAADAEFAGEIESGFDGEAGVGEDEALVVGFEIVEMRSAAMQVRGDAVAGAMGEEVGETGGTDDVSGSLIGLPASNGLVVGVGLGDGGDGGVAGVANGGEDELLALGGLAVHHAGPGDVVEDGVGLGGELAPDIDEDEVAGADGAGGFGRGLVVGVGGVGADGDVGAMLPGEAVGAHGGLEVLDHGDLAGARGAGAAADLYEGFGEEGVDAATGFKVGFELLVGEDGFKLADEIGGGDDLFVEGPDQLDGACVGHGDVHDGVARTVLHGEGFGSGEHRIEARLKFLPRGVAVELSGEAVEASGLDAVGEFLRGSGRGDEVKPAAGDVAVGREAEDAEAEWVAIVMVVEEPAVEVGVAQGGLDGFEVHRLSV
jgi:hypothetical protein